MVITATYTLTNAPRKIFPLTYVYILIYLYTGHVTKIILMKYKLKKARWILKYYPLRSFKLAPTFLTCQPLIIHRKLVSFAPPSTHLTPSRYETTGKKRVHTQASYPKDLYQYLCKHFSLSEGKKAREKEIVPARYRKGIEDRQIGLPQRQTIFCITARLLRPRILP